MTPSEQAIAMLADASSRSALKRLGAELDAAEPALRRAVIAVARSRGVELPDDAESWPGKKLLRRARGREQKARERTNPIRRDEGFTCVACGRVVPPHGRSARDHCPYCLAGLHVDDRVPGDRAASCEGILRPFAVHQERGRWILSFRCERCGVERRNQVLMDGDPPDDWAKVTAITGGMP